MKQTEQSFWQNSATDRVGVVIVNHNAGTILGDCLRSIASQAGEVLVVDNASHFLCLDGVSETSGLGRGLKVLRLPRNLGFAAGCNLGLGACSRDAVLFLNPDCIVAPGLVERLWGVLESDPGIGMVGAFLQNADQTEQRGGRRFIPTPGRALASGFGIGFLGRVWPSLFRDFNLNEQPLPDGPVAVEAVSGACMLVRRAALEDAGAFDEGFFLHCEDLDLCLRFRNHGWKVFFDPQARATHLKGFCGRRKPLFVEWHKHRGMVRFYKKHFRMEYPAILFPIVFLAVWLRFAAVALLSLLSVSDLRGKLVGFPDRFEATSTDPGAGDEVLPDPPEAAPSVGVLGATSFVGRSLLPLLISRRRRVVAFTRGQGRSDGPALVWRNLGAARPGGDSLIETWVSLCPLPVLADLLPKLPAWGAKRLVALSSTSRFTKMGSAGSTDRKLAHALSEAEEAIHKWAAESGVDVVILRPTLIYDGVADKNIAAISKFIRRWGWFPVFAPATGLRQPVHVDDVAQACEAALSPGAKAGDYNLSGGESLAYREMVARIFAWEGMPQRIIEVPRWWVRFAIPALCWIPCFRHLSVGVFERMNEDMAFDHRNAADQLGFKPRKFEAPRVGGIPC